MTALQSVQLEPFTDPDLPELEGIAYGFRVQLARSLLDNAIRGGGRPEYIQALEGALWRRVTDLRESRCTEVWT